MPPATLIRKETLQTAKPLAAEIVPTVAVGEEEAITVDVVAKATPAPVNYP